VQQPNLGDFSGKKANQCLQKAKKGGKGAQIGLKRGQTPDIL
jgi:hypothetical protein